MDLYALASQHTLDMISRHCPGALHVYIHCLNRADENGNVFFSRREIESDMSYTFTKFRNQLKNLAIENLLEWHLIDNGFHVTLADIENG